MDLVMTVVVHIRLQIVLNPYLHCKGWFLMYANLKNQPGYVWGKK